MSNRIDLTGMRVGRLTVLTLDDRAKDGKLKWKCQCDCGNITIVLGNNLKSHTESCGCLLKEARQNVSAVALANTNETIMRALIRDYKRSALFRGFAWSLTDAEAKTMALGDCHYCGIKPSKRGRIYSTKKKEWRLSNFYTNGIDRKDNDKGYVAENCVSCCTTCNYAKRSMSHTTFLGYIDRIINFRSKNAAV